MDFYICTAAEIFSLAVLGALLYGGFNAWRISTRYKMLEEANRYVREPSIAILLEHYPDHEEWQSRLAAAKELYEKEKERYRDFRFVLTVGRIPVYGLEALAYQDERKLVEVGVPSSAIHLYLGRKKKGAVDTLGEVRLACKFIKKSGRLSAYVISNPLQMPLAYFACIWNGVWPVPVTVPLQELRLFWMMGKLFQMTVFIFDPHGINPIYLWMKYRRRHFGI